MREDLYIKGITDFQTYLMWTVSNSYMAELEGYELFTGQVSDIHYCLSESRAELLKESVGTGLEDSISKIIYEITEELNKTFAVEAVECKPVEDNVVEVVMGVVMKQSKQDLLNKISDLIDKYVEVT